MKLFDLKDKYNKPIALALGFFDCIHKGHSLLVNTACNYALSHNDVESALFTFSNDPSVLLGKDKQIYCFDERVNALSGLRLQNVISTKFDLEFAELEPIEFLDLITANYNIKAIITGSDYTFGKKASGDVELLKSYCRNKDIKVITVPFEEVDGHKISTSSMKQLVTTGDLHTLNSLLTEPYFMIGEVIHARRVGTKLGFPTANIRISDDKLPLSNGVYATILQVGNTKYASMTNVGSKPTFDIESFSIEAFILDFDGDLYGQTVKLSFISYLRDIKKFSSSDELKNQLAYNEACVRNLIHLK